MANGHGGQRTPTNPAPVSGPGALSQRTDGPLHGPVPTPMPGPAPSGGGPAIPDPSQLTPFGAPTQRPDEPLSAGLSGGPGAGPSIIQPPPMSPEDQDRLRSYLPTLIVLASSSDASPAVKQFVTQLRGELG